jgi:hypothetical protein
MEKDVFDEMVERWPSAIVARTAVKKFSGGLISEKYMANLDSQQLGPERVKISGKVAYPAKSLAKWISDRARN